MRIEHIAIWTPHLERLRQFYETYFDGQANARYVNPRKQFESYFLTFADGARLELMQRPALKKEGRQKRSALLREKIDVTAFFLWFIENYPDSFTLMRESPEIQDRFR